MRVSSWQAERKKIVARLSIAIYKMTDEQLVSLLHLFKALNLAEDKTALKTARPKLETEAGKCERQLLIAHFFLLINQLSEAELIRFMNLYEQKRFALLREFPRIDCNFTLDIAVDGRAVNCFARNISANGIFLESCEAFTMGQPVSLCFSLEESRLALKLKGRVVRLEHDGVGIKYESMTAYQVEIIKDLIHRIDDHQKSGQEFPGAH